MQPANSRIYGLSPDGGSYQGHSYTGGGYDLGDRLHAQCNSGFITWPGSHFWFESPYWDIVCSDGYVFKYSPDGYVPTCSYSKSYGT